MRIRRQTAFFSLIKVRLTSKLVSVSGAKRCMPISSVFNVGLILKNAVYNVL